MSVFGQRLRPHNQHMLLSNRNGHKRRPTTKLLLIPSKPLNETARILLLLCDKYFLAHFLRLNLTYHSIVLSIDRPYQRWPTKMGHIDFKVMFCMLDVKVDVFGMACYVLFSFFGFASNESRLTSNLSISTFSIVVSTKSTFWRVMLAQHQTQKINTCIHTIACYAV